MRFRFPLDTLSAASRAVPPHAARARLTAVCLSLLLSTVTAFAQGSDQPARPILSIGNYPNVNGLRLNYRDSDLGVVNGANVTLWTPYEPMSGRVNGLALGLPATGAEDINGFAIGVLGIGAAHDITGLTLGGLGAGAGGKVKGIGFGGLGLGAGGSLEGIMIGGIGVGGGGNAKGLIAGGIGAGVGGDMDGIAFGGIGVGAGGRMTGLAIGGIGVGAGDRIHGIAIAGVGVGSPRLEGGFAALFVGAKDAHAVVIAPAQFRIEEGRFEGVSIATSNYIKGSQHGLTIGIVNYARTLNGVQLGIINIVADATGHPILPLLNWGSR